MDSSLICQNFVWDSSCTLESLCYSRLEPILITFTVHCKLYNKAKLIFELYIIVIFIIKICVLRWVVPYASLDAAISMLYANFCLLFHVHSVLINFQYVNKWPSTQVVIYSYPPLPNGWHQELAMMLPEVGVNRSIKFCHYVDYR